MALMLMTSQGNEEGKNVAQPLDVSERDLFGDDDDDDVVPQQQVSDWRIDHLTC